MANDYPIVIRIFWFLIMTMAFTLCAIIGQQTIADNLENPLFSSVTFKPMSSEPFPTLTLFPKRHASDPQVFFKNVLDYFTFDCSNSDYICSQRAEKVKNAFGNDLSVIINTLLDKVARKWKVADAKDFLDRLLCKYQDRLTANSCEGKLAKRLRPTWIQILDANQNKSHVINKLSYVFHKYNLKPQTEELFAKMQNDLQFEGIFGYSICRNRIREADADVLRYLAAFLLGFSCPQRPMLLGSILFSTLRTQSFSRIFKNEFLNNAAAHLIEDTAKYLGLNNEDSKIIKENAKFCTIDDCIDTLAVGSSKPMSVRKDFSTVFSEIFAILSPKEMYQNLALALAKRFGLSQDVIVERYINLPHLWHCTHNGRHKKWCMDLQLTYTSQGPALTLGNGPTMLVNANLRKFTEGSKVPDNFLANGHLKLYLSIPSTFER